MHFLFAVVVPPPSDNTTTAVFIQPVELKLIEPGKKQGGVVVGRGGEWHRGTDLADHMTIPVPHTSAGDRRLKRIPQTPRHGGWEWRGGEPTRGCGEGTLVEKHSVEVRQGKFLFVVMVTSSVVRGKKEVEKKENTLRMVA